MGGAIDGAGAAFSIGAGTGAALFEGVLAMASDRGGATLSALTDREREATEPFFTIFRDGPEACERLEVEGGSDR